MIWVQLSMDELHFTWFAYEHILTKKTSSLQMCEIFNEKNQFFVRLGASNCPFRIANITPAF